MNIVTVLRLHFYFFCLFLCLSIKPAFAFQESNSFQNSEVTAIPADISAIFPSATRIGTADPNLATIPVYQLSQLLGYVFKSDDFTDFIGFSGQTINILIGIDINGVFAGFKVLNHHEPIFLHGLGEQPMFDFIDQYEGHSIKERYIINAQDKSTPGITNFDGITRATVSVMVINDTIIASALQVARAKLEGFAAATTVKIDTEFFQELSFEQLVEQGHISHWQISTEQSLNLAADVSNELISVIEDLTQDADTEGKSFIELYFAFVNIPIIGKNLLGKAEYKRLIESLKPGEHALMVFNRGTYSYISEDFIPQTVPAHLSMIQGEFPVDIRDIDFYSYYDPSFNVDIPDFSQQNIFRIKSQSGFEISQPFDVSLAINYSQSFLSTQQYKFTTDLVLPKELFYTPDVVIEKKQALWVRIWLGRIDEIVVLSLYLIILSLVFIKQKLLARHVNAIHRIRFTMLIFTIFYLGYYSQGQLSVVNIYTLLLSIVNGFRLEVFLLDPIIFILWVFVFISLFIFGRGLFCGWLCPFGALQEVMGLLAKKLSIRQIKISPKHHKHAQKIKYIILFVLVGTSFYSLSLAEKLAEVEPFKTSLTLNFVRYWPFVLYAMLLLLFSLKIHKFYCRYLCPLGAGLAIIGRFPLLKWLTRRKECGSPCQLCRNKKCDIDAINQNGSIDYGECIQCLECLVTIESPKLCVVHKYSNRSIKIKKVG
jgi:NosR/NirI family nitrous oxide reductase transcriptional regulator